MVHGVDAVITGTHEEDKQGGTGDVIRVSFIVVDVYKRQVPSLRIGQGGDIITLAMELQKTKDISYALKTIEGHFPAARCV